MTQLRCGRMGTRRAPLRPAGPEPACWRATDIREADWLRQITADEAEALSVLNAEKDAVVQLGRLSRDVRARLVCGRGVVVLRGLAPPVDTGTAEGVLRNLAQAVGELGTQSGNRESIHHVRNEGQSVGPMQTVRRYRTPGPLGFHTDSGDGVMLWCLRPGQSGGESLFASSLAIHDILLSEAPYLLAELYRNQYFHMSGAQLAGAQPYFCSPVFARTERGVSCRYNWRVLRESRALVGRPTRPELDEALDAFDTVAARDDVHVRTLLQAGDIQILNNYTMVHARTSYEDFPDADKRRHLLRAWIKVDGAARRSGLVEEGLRHGWLSDYVQRTMSSS